MGDDKNSTLFTDNFHLGYFPTEFFIIIQLYKPISAAQAILIYYSK